MKHYYNYMTCFGCIIFMGIMLVIAAITQSNTNDFLQQQNIKVMDLKRDSVFQAIAIKHLIEWHKMTTPQEQREYINEDKMERVEQHVLFVK